MKKINLIGQRYGRLMVLKESEPRKYFDKSRNKFRQRRTWICLCDCGNEHIVLQSSLRKSNGTKSCGCLARERASTSNERLQAITTHGLSNHTLYETWHSIKKRCCNPNDNNYYHYGRRGIKICDEWINDPEAFIKWGINNGWKQNLTIDRIDVNGNYEPDNCRFVNYSRQGFNKRNTNKFGYTGVSKNGKNRFRARIKYQGKEIHLGTFKTVEEAAEARQIKEIEINGGLNSDEKPVNEKVQKYLNGIGKG